VKKIFYFFAAAILPQSTGWTQTNTPSFDSGGNYRVKRCGTISISQAGEQ
jgi:hypothetical protein